MSLDLGNPHGESLLLGVFDGGGEEGEEFGACFSELGAVLGGCVNGDVEDGGCFEHFLGGNYSGGDGVSCCG